MIQASSSSRGRTSGTVFGKSSKGVKAGFGFLLSLMLIGCVSPSPPGDVANVSIAEFQQGNVESGLPIRWGGTVTKVQNKPDVTVLEIVSRPLLRSGRPRHNDQTEGRFLAEINGFLDPEIVAAGRDISVIGTVTRIDTGLVGEAEYQYPVMSVFDYRIWKKPSEIDSNSGYPHYFDHHRFWDGWPGRRTRINGQLVF